MEDFIEQNKRIIETQEQILRSKSFQEWLKDSSACDDVGLPELVIYGHDFKSDYETILRHQAEWLWEIAIRRSWLKKSLEHYLSPYKYYLENEKDIANPVLLKCIEDYKEYLAKEKR